MVCLQISQPRSGTFFILEMRSIRTENLKQSRIGKAIIAVAAVIRNDEYKSICSAKINILDQIDCELLEKFAKSVMDELVKRNDSTALTFCVPTESTPSSLYRSVKFISDCGIESAYDRLEKLRSLKLRVIDNTCRETTVASILGHTLKDKFALANIVTKCGIKDMILGTFSSTHRQVDDQFAKCLGTPKFREQFPGVSFFAFAETKVDSLMTQLIRKPLGAARQIISAFSELPIGLSRAQEYGVQNIILEIDVICLLDILDWKDVLCLLFEKWIIWIENNLDPKSRILINIRDFYEVWQAYPEWVGSLIAWLANREKRIEGILFESPHGNAFPPLIAAYCGKTRQIMDHFGWQDATLGVHVHYGYGLAESTVLECLANGANGIWCGIIRDGAGCGHSNSLTTIANLVRLGNKDAESRFHLGNLRKGAIKATQIVTGNMPHPMTELYGSRALDKVFETDDLEAQVTDVLHISHFGEKEHIRITSMAEKTMMASALSERFGPPPDGSEWDSNTLGRMISLMNQDLLHGLKFDYDSSLGLFALYRRCGGHILPHVRSVILHFWNNVQHEQAQEYRARILSRFRNESGFINRQGLFQLIVAQVTSSDSSDLALAMFAFFESNANAIGIVEAVWPILWAMNEFPSECTSFKNAIDCFARRLVLPYANFGNVISLL